MSSNQQNPQVLGKEELKTEAKWLKLERIKWKDQEGKEVCVACHSPLQTTDCLQRSWEVANRATRSKAGVDCKCDPLGCRHFVDVLAVHILALLHHPSKPVSTIIIEQYRPPIEKTVVGASSV
jgi:ADP-ribose pyrophosphatase